MVGSISSTISTQLVAQLAQLVLSNNSTKAAPATTTTIASTQSSEVNSVKTVKSSQPLDNKKNNNNHNKKKNTSTEQTEQTIYEYNVGGNKVDANLNTLIWCVRRIIWPKIVLVFPIFKIMSNKDNPPPNLQYLQILFFPHNKWLLSLLPLRLAVLTHHLLRF